MTKVQWMIEVRRTCCLGLHELGRIWDMSNGDQSKADAIVAILTQGDEL